MKLELDFAGRTYSQWGEERALSQAFEIISQARGEGFTLVEFGGSRGTDNSNFFHFAEIGYDALFIEMDPVRYRDLITNSRDIPNLMAFNARVGFNDTDNLKSIVSKAKIDTAKIAAVSIDIDSDDAAVFENLGIDPDLVIIEFNPTFPVEGRYRNPKGKQIGNNVGELIHVAKARDYFLSCVSETNLIFMKNRYLELVDQVDVLEEFAKLDLPRFGWGYDGTLIRFSTSGIDTTQEIYHNGWNNALLIQPLPQSLRDFSTSKTWIRLSIFSTQNLIFRPLTLIKFWLSQKNKN
jgi:hypothetical protein